MSNPDLPTFSDRLPDLVQAFRSAGRELRSAPSSQSYIPSFEDIYAVAHSLKGIIGLLSCPPAMAAFIQHLNGELLRALSGTAICRRNAEAAEVFLSLADELDRERAAEMADTDLLENRLAALANLYSEDLPHKDRLREIPTSLFYVSDLVSKKAREITLLQLNQLVLEDEVLLEEIPLWRGQLQEALRSPDLGRGLVVSFLPFLAPERSKTLLLWAWVAAASPSRAVLKQRIKETMPKVRIGKL